MLVGSLPLCEGEALRHCSQADSQTRYRRCSSSSSVLSVPYGCEGADQNDLLHLIPSARLSCSHISQPLALRSLADLAPSPSPQKFIVPHLQPPDETDLEAAQKALEAKYDEASELLKNLQVSTDSLAASLDEQKAAVEKELVEVRKGVEEMREGEKRREEWSKKVGEQVDEVVKGLPNVSCSLPPLLQLSLTSQPAAHREASHFASSISHRSPNRAQVT